MEDTNLEAPPETPSDASVPDEDVPETPSGEETEDEPEADEETGDEPDDEPAADDESAEAEADEAPSDDEDDEGWRNFEKKFHHIKNPRDRKAAMGKAWWDKNNFASRTLKENEELKARLARLETQPARDEKPPEPATPPPELARIDQRIQQLYQKDQAIGQQVDTTLKSLSAVDKEIAVLEDRAKDAEEYQKALLEQRLETAKIKRDGLLNRYADLHDKRENISLEMEQRLSDRDWTQKFLQQKATREQQEQQSLEQFNAEFPQHVDRLITSAADQMGVPKDQAIRKSLWRSVNRAMIVDLDRMRVGGISEVDVPTMVRSLVKEYLDDHEMVGRSKFTRTSTEKLRATSRGAATPPSRPVPATKKPVPLALLTTSDTSPAMLRARRLLQQRLGGGARS